MNLNEFVNKIFLRYPPDLKGNDTEEALMLDYIKALDTGKDYDYDKTFTDLMLSYSFKTLPTAKIIMETMKQNERKPTKPQYDDWRLPDLWGYKKSHKCWYQFSVPDGLTELDGIRYMQKLGLTKITHLYPYGAQV